MSDDADPLLALAHALGVLPAWIDLGGNLHVTGRDTALALCRAMGALADASEAPDALAAHRDREARRRLPHARVVAAWQPDMLPLPGGPADWRLTFETGATAEGRAEGALELPALPAGLHRLEAAGDACLVVAAPPRAPSLHALTGRERAWGVTASLYGLRSATGAELGTYADLADTAEALAGLGAAFLGVNPVHAIGAASGAWSPYSPGHRGFLDTRHITAETPATAGELIDHDAHRAASTATLRARFAREVPEPFAHAGLAAFRAERGHALADFALFEALSLRHGADWRGWPAGLESPDTPAARAFAEENPREIAFHAWLQWLADRELASAQGRAKSAGMALGLYTDLAVGVRPDGAEVWARPAAFARGVSLGAPPDQFSPTGQSWALAPLSPPGLAAEGYASFVETIRAVVRHAGVIRIDHVIGFERAFWVPGDGTPGGFVRSDTDVLFAIVRVEAARAGTLVVGEDLGVVPEGLRDRLDASGLHGSAVAMYEHDHDRLRHPREYRPATLASFGTHDTPTMRGWWEDNDIAWRERIGSADADDARRMREERARDRRALLHHLAGDWLLPPGLDPDHPPAQASDELLVAIHALLARASSAVVAVQLDDALGALEQPNLPGTVDQHPNWRRRHALPAAALPGHPVLARIARAMRDEGRA